MRLRRDPKRRRRSLRCLLGRHGETRGVEVMEDGSRWLVVIDECVRCWRPVDVSARHKHRWRR